MKHRVHIPSVALAAPGFALLVAGAFGAVTMGDEQAERAPQDGPNASESTPAERAIARARAALQQDGPTAEEHVALAAALSQRARETADPAWYNRSDAVLELALELRPDDFAARRQGVWNQLGRHEFAAGLEGARALNERAKDDVATYGLIVDACVELGRYDEAEEAAQWMLDLRPGNPAAMARVSYLRELFGDVSGAIEAMRSAFHSTRTTSVEERAWYLTHLAHLELAQGRAKAAEGFVTSALALFPDYHYALAQYAAIASHQGEHERARELRERHYAVAPHPENLFELACVVADCGDAEDARAGFEEFEQAALGESENLDNANLSLIEYWLEHSGEAADVERALALAERRATQRRDVSTLAALGWARHRSGDPSGALAAFDEAIAVGSQDARLRRRAGDAAEAAGDLERARVEWTVAWRQDPSGPDGAAAGRALLRLEQD